MNGKRVKYLFLLLLIVACTKKPVENPCDPVTQPSPHFGERNGLCLKSCGALGGQIASNEKCEDRGLIDAGTAYDVAYCCNPRETPIPTPEPTSTPQPTPLDQTPPDNASGPGRAPPKEQSKIEQLSAQFPGLINNCVGKPVANEFLIKSIRKLQETNKRWGFMKKSGGRIPRDILAYAWGSEREGTTNFFVIDFVIAGCNNLPAEPNFNDPMPNATPAWQLLNLETATADNGTWSFNHE